MMTWIGSAMYAIWSTVRALAATLWANGEITARQVRRVFP
jgi:hypothetical protein